MDLLYKSIIAAVLVAIVLIGAYTLFTRIGSSSSVSPVQAEQLILKDIKSNYPDAAVNIINLTNSTVPGSYYVTASVVINASRACPSYSIYTFEYPAYGFVYRTQNQYTGNCVVYGLNRTNYLIASSPVAITRATSVSPDAQSFITKFGYPNVVVDASFMSRYVDPISTSVYSNVWLVNYTSSYANYTVSALISQLNGTLLYEYKIFT